MNSDQSLNRESLIVDIPSGAGAFVKRLLDHGYSNVLAVDIENSMEVETSQFQIGDMTKTLPLSAGEADSLVCIDGIEHIHDQFSFVQEVNRILKPGGTFMISTPNISAIRSRFRWFVTGHHNKGKVPLAEKKPHPSHHVSLISFPELRYLLHVNGFEIESITSNRIKAISWLYSILFPILYVFTKWIYSTEKDPVQKELNHEIFDQVMTRSILFGETMIVKARKRQIL